MTKIKNLKEQLRYWQNKVKELETKINKMESYQKGFTDATYYLGGRK